MEVRFPFRYHAGSYLAILPLVCHQQGLPWLYGDLKTRSLFPVYRTHDKGGLRAASAIGSPPFLLNSSQASGRARASGTPDTGCMHAGGSVQRSYRLRGVQGRYPRLGVGYTLKYLPAERALRNGRRVD